MRLSIVVAVAENGVIGRRGSLPWRLSDDLKMFKRLTTGHTIVMGRKTWESIGRALPGRRSVVITRGDDFRAEGAEAVHSLAEALELTERDDEVFITGGAEVFREALSQCDRIYLTRVHANVDGDVFFPPIDWREWREVAREEHSADEKNQYPFTFLTYDRA